MSPRHRKIPARHKAPSPDELEELEPVEELPTLAADAGDDDGPVRIRCAPATEAGFDTDLAIEVPAMDKKAVTEAVSGPLGRAVERHRAALRLRRVLVQFPGEAMIGTATKDLVATLLAAAKPLAVVVRRGYGDELVHEGALPRVPCQARAGGDGLHIAADTSAIEAEDVAVALAAELSTLPDPRDQRVTFEFQGAQPDAAAHDMLRARLREAGAARVAVGTHVLFDRDLEARVRVSDGPEHTAIDLTPAATDADTRTALRLVLGAGDRVRGRSVRARIVGRAPSAADAGHLLAVLGPMQPARVELLGERGAADVLWPSLLAAAAEGGGTTLRVQLEGRDGAAVAAAFGREAGALASAIAGQSVTVDWPAGYPLDAATERAMLDALAAHAARRVSCTFGGDGREPFAPPAVTVAAAAGGVCRIGVDLDAGKPAELVRALERRVRAAASAMRGQHVRVEVHGAGAPARTLLRAVRDEFARAGASRVEVDEQGTVDVLLPALLQIKVADTTVRVHVEPAGRDRDQVARALARELEAANAPADAQWFVAPSAHASAVIDALVGRGVARVVLDAVPPVQVHPPLFAAATREADRLLLRAAPASDEIAAAQVDRELPALLAQHADLASTTITLAWPGARMPLAGSLGKAVAALVAARPARVLLDGGRDQPRQVFPEIVPEFVRVLGRRDDPGAPMLMLGIEAAADTFTAEEYQTRVLQKLEALADHMQGRRVLLVSLVDGRDAAVKDRDPLLAAVRAFVDARAAATLVFRGPDPHGRPHFVAAHSTAPDVLVGGRFGDPRGKRT